MTDTVRTTTDLLSKFAAGQFKGIDSQDMRDFIKTFDVQRGATINVKDAPYNCKGDGVSDDTTGLQAAIDAGTHSNALLGVNAHVFLPFGNYKITSALRLHNIMLHMEGSGKYESVIHYE
jgi:polygalacturonase